MGDWGNIPRVLQERDSWITYWIRPKAGGKTDKIPTGPWTAREHWLTFWKAVENTSMGFGHGIGIVTAGNPDILFSDLDWCIDGEGRISPLALEIVQACNTYTEISPSGRGLRMFSRCQYGTDYRGFINAESGVEIYTGNDTRFATVTGAHLDGTSREVSAITDHALRLLEAHRPQVSAPRRAADDLPDLLPEEAVRQLQCPALGESHLQLLQHGTAFDRSGTLAQIATTLVRNGWTGQQIISWLWLWDEVRTIAADHRHGDEGRGLEWLWTGVVWPQLQRAGSRPLAELFRPLETQEIEAAAAIVPPDTVFADNDSVEAVQNDVMALQPNDFDGLYGLIKRGILLDREEPTAWAHIEATIRAAGFLARQVKDLVRRAKRDIRAVRSEHADRTREHQTTVAHQWQEVGRSSGDFLFVTTANRMFLHKAHGSQDPVFLTREAFCSAFSHERRGTDDDRESTTAWYNRWMEEHPDQIVSRLTFRPGRPSGVIVEDGVRAWNVWERPAIQPRADVDPSPWLQLKDHLKIADSDWEYLLDALAYKIQHPETKIRHILLLGGQQGVGKDSLLAPIAYLLGAGFGEVGSDQLRKDFNSFLFQKEMVVIGEAFRARSKDLLAVIEQRLKMWSTQSTIPIEFKGLNVTTHPNLLYLVLTTNYKDAVPVAKDDRRFFALWCEATYTRDELDAQSPWWSWYHTDWIPNGGAAAVLNFLLQRDVSHFFPGKQPPLTEWNGLLREIHLSDYDEFAHEMRSNPKGAWELPLANWKDLFSDAIAHGLPNHLNDVSKFRGWLRKTYPRIERKSNNVRYFYYIISDRPQEVISEYGNMLTYTLRKRCARMLEEARKRASECPEEDLEDREKGGEGGGNPTDQFKVIQFPAKK